MAEARNAYAISSGLVTPIGLDPEGNFDKLVSGISGVRQIENEALYPSPFMGSCFEEGQIDDLRLKTNAKSGFETMAVFSIQSALEKLEKQPDPDKTIFILSTTKGNIDALSHSNGFPEDAFLYTSAKRISDHFDFPNKPVVVSNACVSGVLALNMASRLIENGIYDHAVVCGADIVSEFVISGFDSFMAISDEVCRPYDADRKGINLGEGAATLILSCERTNNDIRILAGFTSNDANHISGPSRTGDGLYRSIHKTLEFHGIQPEEIDLVNAHGTATLFNDDMESRAFKLSGLQETPVHSLKAFYGHTLGAAGLIETVILMECMRKGIGLKSNGFEYSGTAEHMNVLRENKEMNIRTTLKTASGFGGCNASIILKTEHA